MGQKVHPYGFRLGYTKPWKSRWFVERDYDKLLLEDIKLKNELKDKLKSAGVSAVEIERPGNKLRIIIKTARPGIIIGRKGAEIDKLKGDLQKRTSREVFVDIQEVHKPELDAQLVSEADCAATGKAGWFPPCHAKSGRLGAAFRLQRNQGSRQRAVEWQRNRALGMVSAGPVAAAYAARRHRIRILRSEDDVWRDRREVLGVQGRNSSGRKSVSSSRGVGAF